MLCLGLVGTGAAEDRGKKKGKSDAEKLQGTWNIMVLELDGKRVWNAVVPESLEEGLPGRMPVGPKIIIKGDDFTTISLGATYKGKFKIDESRTPKALNVTFTEGPEKGKTALAIYELTPAVWKLCMAVTAKERPKELVTQPGSGYALETLVRVADQPTPGAPQEPKEEKLGEATKKELERLGGDWEMVSGERDGQAFPQATVATGKRVAKGNQTTATLGGQVILKATFRLDMGKSPKAIDYDVTDGPAKGIKMLGIYALDGDTVRFCFSTPGSDRPKEFTTKAGDQCTLTVWKKVKK